MNRARFDIWVFVVLGASLNLANMASAQATDTFWKSVGETVSEAPVAPQVKATDSPDSVEISFRGFGFSDTYRMEETVEYTALSIPGCGLDGEVGDPAMPFKGIWLEIPYGVEVKAVVEKAEPESITTLLDVLPMQPPEPNSSDEKPPFTKNEASYETNMFFPGPVVEVDQNSSGTNTILNSTFYGNHAAIYSGALRVSSSSVDVDNSIFWGDTQGYSQSQGNHHEIGYGGTTTLIIHYSDVEDCEAGTPYLPQCSISSNNDIDEDPLFIEPAALNFRIPDSSPCNDRINTTYPPTDIELNPRDEFGDMGAYECQMEWP